MCIKKLLAGLITTSLVLATGVPCFAAGTADEGTVSVETAKKGQEGRPELTEEEKQERQELKEKMKAAQQKWAALTKAQKEKIYELQQKADEIKLKMIDEYVSLGIFDEAAAKDMKSNISNRLEQMKKEDRMPMIWCGRKPR